MYALIRKNAHVVWREWWCALMLGISLQVNLYMIRNNQVFIVDVVVTNLMQKMVVSSVINRLANVAPKLSAIVKIH
jgi:hypothetical protein